MAIKIRFDPSHVPEAPTIVLANRNGEKLGQIPAKNIIVKSCLNSAAELSFCVYKFENSIRNHIWDKIVSARLAWCKEWDTWFELSVDTSESNKTVKNVSGTQLGQAELSQRRLYGIEINTEDDIGREDYEATVLFNADRPNASLLHRIMEKVPHYSISHVDSTIANIQRTFSFDDVSIYDAFQEIAEEIGCLFVFHSNTEKNGKIGRTISVYDLQSSCSCGYRGEFTEVCPKCGSSDIREGYGQDTTIFITSDELADDIQFTTDTDSVKNCFKLEAGDDLMTATVRNCNPNGSDYIWHITNDLKSLMSKELVEGLEKYDETYDYYNKDCQMEKDLEGYPLASYLDGYNGLVEKYHEQNNSLKEVTAPIIGHSGLMEAYYNTVDLAVYLQSAMMPDVEISDTSAAAQLDLLSNNLKTVAVSGLINISEPTANSTILSSAKTIVDSRYQVKIISSSLSPDIVVPLPAADKKNIRKWTGHFIITNYSDEKDSVDSSLILVEPISVELTNDRELYLRQTIDKMIKTDYSKDLSISGLFKMERGDFHKEIKKYCLNRLVSFHDACQACIKILDEQGVSDEEAWADIPKESNLYTKLYVPYRRKLRALEKEIQTREGEIHKITGTYDENGGLLTAGLQTVLLDYRNKIQEALDFETFLGKNWIEFCSYCREDKYSNSNYISDGLDNAALFKRALEFIETASNELYKSAELQHSISSSLKNLLVMEKFQPLVNYFEMGNWVRIRIDDKVYKLRLMEYEINYDELDSISVGFSDVMNVYNGVSDLESIVQQAGSMAKSYNYVQRQASQGAESNSVLQGWRENGMEAENVKLMNSAANQSQIWDKNGMLFRQYDFNTEAYLDTQLKIVNSTIAITDDNWQTVKTAVGGFYYTDPETGKKIYSYGINGEALVGKLILGEQLGIYSRNNSLTFDDNGLEIKSLDDSQSLDDSNDKKRYFKVTPNNNDIFLDLQAENGRIFIDQDGQLHIKGDGKDLDMTNNSKLNANIEGKIDGKLDSDLAARIVQSHTAVQKSWNGVSKQIQLETTGEDSDYGELCVYEANSKDSSSENLASKISPFGHYFFKDNDCVGRIETEKQPGKPSHKGLVFDLEPEGGYLAFRRKDSDTEACTAMLCFSRENSAYPEEGIHFGCDMYGHQHRLDGVNLSNVLSDSHETITAVIPIVVGLTTDKERNISPITAHITVRNGLITEVSGLDIDAETVKKTE